MKPHVKRILAVALLAIVLVIVTVAVSPAIFWRVWDGYPGPQAKRAVAVAAARLAKGELVSSLRLRPSVAQADLSAAFASGFEVTGFDPIGLSLNGYEVMVRVKNGDQYNFDVYKSEGEWQLDCCSHWRVEELKKIHRR